MRHLRAVFIVASGLLVATTVAANAWTLVVLNRLGESTENVAKSSDATTAAAGRLSTALEREDDALLVALHDPTRARSALEAARKTTDDALAELHFGAELDNRLAQYRSAVDAIVSWPGATPLERYHLEANPPLREAIAEIAAVRERRFAHVQRAVENTRDEIAHTRSLVIVISALALAASLLVALWLSRLVIGPLRELARGAGAIRDGDFDTRISIARPDELGQVGVAFNEMAVRLGEFHRANIGEIVRAHRTLEALTNALPDAVVLIGLDGAVVSANPAAETLFREAGRASPKRAEDLEALGIVFAPRAEQAAVDLGAALRIASRRYTVRIVPTSSGAVVVMSDVTELAKLDEMRIELVAVASHELRTPVTTLRMCLSMLRERSAPLDPKIQELVETGLRGVEQLAETVDELLDMSQIEAGALKLANEPLDLRRIADDALARARPRAGEVGIQLAPAFEAEVPLVLGDRARLRLVLDNLLDNALKYTPAGGRVVLGIRGATDVELDVTDTGPGIPDELRGRVFEKFFRVEHQRPERANGARGSGIGLYLCRQIVALHAGTIRCESGPEGLGTKIAFAIPAYRPRA